MENSTQVGQRLQLTLLYKLIFFTGFTRDMLTQSAGSPKGELTPREIAANAGDAWMAAT